MKPRASPRLGLLHDDADLTAIDKPPGLTSISERWDREAPTAIDLLWRIWQGSEPDAPRPHVVHRLDKDTSGVLLFARHAAAQGDLRRQFRERTVEKRYFALTSGTPSPPEGCCEISVEKDPGRPGRMRLARRGGKACRTEYRTLAVHGTHSWVELHPLTGRTHQIRITLRELGAPCVSDLLYGDGEPLWLSKVKPGYRATRGEPERPLLGRLGLHAASLALSHPGSGEPLRIESPLPKDLRATLTQLERWAR
jgi:23S rRNA pseudouridine1911/1915/1917 synthase